MHLSREQRAALHAAFSAWRVAARAAPVTNGGSSHGPEMHPDLAEDRVRQNRFKGPGPASADCCSFLTSGEARSARMPHHWPLPAGLCLLASARWPLASAPWPLPAGPWPLPPALCMHPYPPPCLPLHADLHSICCPLPAAAAHWPLAYAQWALPVRPCPLPARRPLPSACCPLAAGLCPLATPAPVLTTVRRRVPSTPTLTHHQLPLPPMRTIDFRLHSRSRLHRLLRLVRVLRLSRLLAVGGCSGRSKNQTHWSARSDT